MTNKERYALLCQQEKSICVYDQPWWLDAVCGADNWDVLLYEKREKIVASLPYFIKKKYGIAYVTQPLFTQHCGIWIKYPDQCTETKKISFEKEVLNCFIDELEKLPIQYFQQQISPNLKNWLPFYWRGYHQNTNYTYRISDIKSEEIILGNCGKNKRRSIKKAKELDLHFHLDMAAEEFYSFHKTNLQKRNITISYSLELFQKMYDAAYQHGQGKTAYLADDNGKVYCALFNIWDHSWGYDLIGTLAPEYYGTGAMDLLELLMMDYLSDYTQGYDFEGSMIESIEESYRNFGGEQTPYFRLNKILTRNPIVGMAIKYQLK